MARIEEYAEVTSEKMLSLLTSSLRNKLSKDNILNDVCDALVEFFGKQEYYIDFIGTERRVKHDLISRVTINIDSLNIIRSIEFNNGKIYS